MDGHRRRFGERLDVYRRRQFILAVTCLGALMVALDNTIVSIALPSIRQNLGFTEISLVWVVNGYLVPFAGLSLLCGRLGDHYSRSAVFAVGLALFTLASLGCGIAASPAQLIVARIAQGVGASAIWSVALSMIMQQFEEQMERAEALAIYSCVAACGGVAGVVLGGILTNELGWRWIFLINIPIGAIAFALCCVVRIESDRARADARLDVMGALTLTSSLTLTVLAVVDSESGGWDSPYFLLTRGGALLSVGAFLAVELRATFPIVSPAMLRHGHFRIMLLVVTLWAAAQQIWPFVTTLYLQGILGYSARKAALAFFPAAALMAVFCLGLSARVVVRFGARLPFIVGLSLVVAAQIALAVAPECGSFRSDVLPAMLIMGLGCGIAYSPLVLSVLRDINEANYGMASGVINTAMVVGGAVALALAARLVVVRRDHLVSEGLTVSVALNSGYHVAFIAGAVFALGALLISVVFVRSDVTYARSRQR